MKREIHSLTSIRGLAAVYVVLYHSYPSRGAFINHGYIAVDLFFLLSGFVMCLSYGHYFEHRVTFRSFLSFIIRRLGRIYPLYILCTLVSALILRALGMKFGDGLPPQISLLLNVVMVQAWGLSGSIDYPTWSLSTEWFAYLMFPFLTILILRYKTSSALSIISTSASIGILTALALVSTPAGIHRSGPLDVSWNFSFLPVLRCVCEFMIGMRCFVICEYVDKYVITGHTNITIVISFSLLLLMFSPNSDLVILLLFAMLIVTLASGSGLVCRVLEYRPFILLGEMSYSIYLLHPIVLYMGNTEIQLYIGKALNGIHIVFPLSGVKIPVKAEVYPALLVSSYVVHRYFELPLRNVIRHFIPKPYDLKNEIKPSAVT